MFLMDQIVNGKRRDGLSFRISFAKAISSSQKFVLGGSISEAADAVGVNEMRRVALFCRPPFASCWFEALEAERPNFFGSPILLMEPDEFPYHRVGVLAECQNAEATMFTLSLAWAFEKGVWELSSKSVLIDLDDMAAGGPSKLLPCRFWAEDVNKLDGAGPMGMQMLRYLDHRAGEDWGGEAIFWLSALGLLNAKNATEATTVDNVDLNRRRRRLGRPPLCDHKKVVIRIGNAGHRSTAKGAEPTKQDVRAHFVMGHFKVRKTGLFWWSPHVRGNLARGFAGKDYHVQMAKPKPCEPE